MKKHSLKILILGSGGREHALGWKIKQSPRVSQVFFAPGNPGTAETGTNISHDQCDLDNLVRFCKDEGIDLVIVGPETFLAEGVIDKFQSAGIVAFGPTKAAATIETSKDFAKRLMMTARIPTATYLRFDSFEHAVKEARILNCPCFIKADGLASGKGAILCQNAAEAEVVLRRMMVDLEFGPGGKTVLIEHVLEGSELSLHAVCDANHSIMFPASRDHKRAFDGDKGENTGGMGAIVPVHASTTLMGFAKEMIVNHALEAMESAGLPFRGLLFPGIMLTDKSEIKVLEYNARFGDPEAQVYMRLMESDLVDLLEAAACDKLRMYDIRQDLKWNHGYAISVTLASGGYPDKYETGLPISGIEEAEKLLGIKVFHGATALRDGQLVTDGGRVLHVTCNGIELDWVKAQVYRAVDLIHFKGMHFRRDIGLSLLADVSGNP